MPQLQTFSTAGLTPRRKLEYWNDIACDTFTPVVSDPLDLSAFSGALMRTKAGDVSVAEVDSDAQIVRHSRLQVARSREAMFFLHMQLEGQSINRQDGREAHLMPGDFTLCDSTRPYEIQFDSFNRMFVLGFPEAVLRRHLPCPESIVAVPMSGSAGMSGLLSDFLTDFWTRCRSDESLKISPAVMHAILDLVACTYAAIPQPQADRSSLVLAHRVRIMNYIETHLGDPDLTPTRIADACRMTTRYLHHLFSEETETVARYILRRRLEECSRALTAPSLRGRTVTSIAFDYGFNSPTHFGRVFRARYGVTPREYRHSQEDTESTAPA